MKSINVKKVAAIAAGAGMISSVMASGLAAVSTSGDVSTFVSTVKGNLDKVQVVVGTSGADISDGVAAAKLAAVLADLNYRTGGAGGSGTLSNKKVTVSTTGSSGGAIINPAQFDIIYTGGINAANNFKTGGIGSSGNTITPVNLGQVLSKRDISVVFGGSLNTYKYQEEIRILPSFVQYSE